MSRLQRAGSVVLMVLVLALGSLAQQRARVGRNVLDASPQIGAGSYNTPIRRSYGRNYGNLYITGNITSGKSFRGTVPYSDPTQLRIGLGSSSLSSFVRDSTGLAGVSRSPYFGRALPYYNPSSTVLPLAAQRSGLARPGSAIPRRPVLRDVPGLAGPIRLPTDRRLRFDVPTLPAGIQPSDVLVPILEPTPFAEKIEPTKPTEVEPKQTTALPSPDPQTGQDESSEPALSLTRPEPLEPASAAQQATPSSRFMELLLDAQQSTEQQSFRVEAATEAKSAEAAERMIRRTTATRPAGAERSVDTLAAADRDALSQTMRAAERLLGQGRFRDAVDMFRQAGRLAPDDPLPILGHVHALIAAGELRDAAAMLQHVIARFPTLLYLRLDGQRLLGGKTILDRRVNQVRRLVKHVTDREFLLLAGYVELLAGDRGRAYDVLERAGAIRRRPAGVK